MIVDFEGRLASALCGQRSPTDGAICHCVTAELQRRPAAPQPLCQWQANSYVSGRLRCWLLSGNAGRLAP